MGAPTLVDEKLVTSIETMTALKLVTSIETMTALRQLEKALASGVCEVDEGKSGNEKVAVTCRTLSTGEKVWVADEADLKKIDIGPTIPLVSDSKCVLYLAVPYITLIVSFSEPSHH